MWASFTRHPEDRRNGGWHFDGFTPHEELTFERQEAARDRGLGFAVVELGHGDAHVQSSEPDALDVITEVASLYERPRQGLGSLTVSFRVRDPDRTAEALESLVLAVRELIDNHPLVEQENSHGNDRYTTPDEADRDSGGGGEGRHREPADS